MRMTRADFSRHNPASRSQRSSESNDARLGFRAMESSRHTPCAVTSTAERHTECAYYFDLARPLVAWPSYFGENLFGSIVGRTNANQLNVEKAQRRRRDMKTWVWSALVACGLILCGAASAIAQAEAAQAKDFEAALQNANKRIFRAGFL